MGFFMFATFPLKMAKVPILVYLNTKWLLCYIHLSFLSEQLKKYVRERMPL